MRIITYLHEILLMKKVLAISLLVVSPLLFLKSVFAGIFIFAIGLNMIAMDGAEIDLEHKKYRTIKSVLGMKFGAWKVLPNFEYVSVFKTKESTQVNAYGATMATFKNDIILLNLFYTGNKYITFYKTDNLEDAFRVADQFKVVLKIDVLDATGSEKVWL